MTEERTVRADHRQERRERRAQRHTREETRAERREELLDAAMAGIRKHGAGASMEVLAAEAGITKPILYRHFDDRAGLVNAIADRFATQLEHELLAAIEDVADNTHEVLVRVVDAFVAYIERDTALYRFIVSPRYDATVDLGGFLNRLSAYIAVGIGEQLRRDGRDSGGAEVIAHGVVAFVHASGDWWVDRQTMPRAQLVAYVADFLSTGFNGQWGSTE
ncbi:MAG: TetR/AcrR family transcriptional regulator [Acidimicrobiales bacterium]|nr:TetR/AcrR family transcriptional regulator [Acidimicrobiales bacterium]